MPNKESAKPLLEILPQIPDPNLLFICETPSQFNAWYEEKEFCTDLHYLLFNYFTGQAPPELANRAYRDILELEADKWISFYDLLFFGWGLIKSETERTGIDLEEMGMNSPGDILKAILYYQSKHSVLQSMAYHLEFNPRKAHHRSAQFIELYKNQTLSEDEKQSILDDTRYQQIGETVSPSLFSLYGFCLRVFIQNRDNPRIKEKCDTHIRHWVTTLEICKRSTHPKKRMGGFVTCNGIKYKRHRRVKSLTLP